MTSEERYMREWVVVSGAARGGVISKEELQDLQTMTGINVEDYLIKALTMNIELETRLEEYRQLISRIEKRYCT